MTRLSEITHNDHDHICVNCNHELFEANETNKGRKKFLCVNDDCNISIAICNGDLTVTSTTVDDLVEAAESIFNYLEDSKGFKNEQLQSVSSIQKSLRKMIQEEKKHLVSEELHEDIQEEFQNFTEIAKSLHKKENEGETKQSPDGNEVIEMNGLYFEKNNILLYTILFYPEQEEGDLHQKPIDPEGYFEDFEIEDYKIELEDSFEQSGLTVDF